MEKIENTCLRRKKGTQASKNEELVPISQMLRIRLVSRWQALRLVLRCAQDCRIAAHLRNWRLAQKYKQVK
ncbi:MAG: hypothetical protein K6F51_14275 [Acetatifactor sp.]|nr:hypothetical protein [Acetatifactor sp.]